jgi:hypothetical protein
MPNLKVDGEIKRIWVCDGDERRKAEIFGEGRRS